MILLDAAAHWSRLDLQPASHLLFIWSATSALVETEQASNARYTIATKRMHPPRQNLVLIAARPLAFDSHPRRLAARTLAAGFTGSLQVWDFAVASSVPGA